MLPVLFVQKNESQIKKSLVSPKHLDKPICVISYTDKRKKLEEQNAKGILEEKAKAVDIPLAKKAKLFQLLTVKNVKTLNFKKYSDQQNQKSFEIEKKSGNLLMN